MEEISGILNINKPSGVTSFWAVKQVRRILGVKKVGHCGTLDPLAEGVLVVLFGKATKLQSSLMSGKKTYRARFKLGVTTDTGDINGKVKKESDFADLEVSKVKDAAKTFMGGT
jgi:tRNA pseudouridine55 synthase